MKSLGPKLRKLRLERDKKQEELADLLGIKQQQYSKMERGGVKNVKIEHLQTICKFYNVNIEYLIGDTLT